MKFEIQNHWDYSFILPVVQGFDHLPLDLSQLLSVLSKALEEPHQMHKHHFVK